MYIQAYHTLQWLRRSQLFSSLLGGNLDYRLPYAYFSDGVGDIDYDFRRKSVRAACGGIPFATMMDASVQEMCGAVPALRF